MNQAAFDKVHRHIEEIMPRIVQPAEGSLRHAYLSVSYGPNYAKSIYCWDNQHMNMRFAYAGEPAYFRCAIDNLLHHQRGDGFTPNVVSALMGPSQNRPPFHSQPFLMQGALLYARRAGDLEWPAAVYPKLVRYLAYTEANWSAPYGLFRWPLAYMSGFDNDVVTTFFQPDTIIPCDVNAWIYLEYLAAAKLAAALERTAESADYAAKADALRSSIDSVLWHEDAGSYAAFNLCANASQFGLADRFVTDAGKFAFQTCSNLVPLYARLAQPAQAKRMIETYVLSEDHFLSPWGIRSLSRSSEYYNNALWGNPPRYGSHDRMTNSNWQGPVWIPLCYFMFHALRHYGYRERAEDLADRTVAVLAQSLDRVGSFAENFHGETGAPLYCRNFASWNILADMMHEELRTGKWIMDCVFDDTE